MKKLLILSLTIFSTITQSARICEGYITDEWPDTRYRIETISTDIVVTDSKTGLMWKQCIEGLSGTDCMTGSASSNTWQATLEIPETLNNNLGFAGFTNWRVPNIEELRSIVAINCYNPSINDTVFPNTVPTWYWSSSLDAYLPYSAWNFNFDYGFDYKSNRDSNYYVRLVRSIQ